MSLEEKNQIIRKIKNDKFNTQELEDIFEVVSKKLEDLYSLDEASIPDNDYADSDYKEIFGEEPIEDYNGDWDN